MTKTTSAIVIEDGTYSFDTRVQRQSQALLELGLNPIVICPCGKGERPGKRVENGITVLRYPAYEATGFNYLHRLVEHSLKLIFPMFIILYLRAVKRAKSFQFCNPTDFSALLGKLISLTGAKYIYDQHDLVPEIYKIGTAAPNSAMLGILEWFEKCAYRWSDHVIVVNDSFNQVAMTRGGIPQEKITIVRNGPNDAIFKYQASSSANLENQTHRKIGYIGNVNTQDGLDLLVDVAVEAKKRDIPFIFEIIGDGGGLSTIKTMVKDLNVTEYFNFHGRKHWGGGIEEIIARCVFCVQPDPFSELNEKCSMTKSLEYLARGKTFVSFPLKETLFTCTDFAYFADDFDNHEFIRKFLSVLDTHIDENGAFDRRQNYIRDNFSWSISERAYVDVYRKLLKLK